MHSRTGLQTEYLSDEWFEVINACADRAEELGLEAWLYDEDRWPSGSAGGLATQRPEFRLKSLRLSVVPAAEFTWEAHPEVVTVLQGEVDGLAVKSLRPLLAGAAALPTSAQVLVFTTEITQPHSFYNGNTYLDTLQRAATDHFIELTHERYRQQCGDRLGRSIRGIFTDEPHHGMVMCHQTETRQDEAPEWTTPFTKGLFEEFIARFGYDLRPRLAELFLFPDGERISQVKWHYMELIQQLFLENWAQPLHNWCRKHNLILTGHALHEDSLAAQAVPCGSLMRYYEYLDYPGVDVLGNDNRNFFIAKQLSSAARQLGKPWMLSELYGCSGWQLDFTGHKEIGDWQALFGINLRCHHLAWYSMAGEAKRDYPASIFFQSGWHGHYRVVEDYFSRLHLVLQQGEAVCDLLVLNPIESLWAQVHAGWATWLSANDPGVASIEDQYRVLFTWLNRAHLDFDYGDEDQLRRHGSVDAHPVPLLRLGQSRYRVVVIAGMETIRSSSLALLAEFIRAGGKVLFAGPPPPYVDALPSPAARELASQAEQTGFQEDAIASALGRFSQSPFALAEGQPAAAVDLLAQIRRDGPTWYLVLLNTSKSAHHRHVHIRFQAAGEVQEWDCRSGARFAQAAQHSEGALVWEADFPPLAERVFVIGPATNDPLPLRVLAPANPGTPLPGPYSYELNEPNICVLDFAQFQLAGGGWQSEREILQVDHCVRETLGILPRSGAMVQPWARSHPQLQPTPPKTAGSTTPLRLRFAFEIDLLPEDPIAILIENPHDFLIWCNGVPVPTPEKTSWFIDPCFRRVPLAKAALCLGKNVIELVVGFHPELDLEPIYLLGSFGVALPEEAQEGIHARLIALPEKLSAGDLCPQGLPFYSGCISYRLATDLPLSLAEKAWLQTDAFGGAVITLGANAVVPPATIAWPPYQAEVSSALAKSGELLCHLWLTRRNTFGPLHLTPKQQSHIGPESFRSSGSAFTQSYQLYPSGLLCEPRIIRQAPSADHSTPAS